MIFLLELLIKRCNSRYGRTRLVGKQSDAFFLVMGCLWSMDGIFYINHFAGNLKERDLAWKRENKNCQVAANQQNE